MANGIGQVHVRKQRGQLVVIGFGQSPRGQKFIRDYHSLEAASPADPKFKGELKAAVEKLLG